MSLLHRRIGAVTLLGALAFLGVTAFSQITDTSTSPQQKKDHIVAPAETVDTRESRRLENSVRLSKPNDEQERAVGAHFQHQATPPIRATYFRSVLESPDFCFKRWDIRILEVAVADGITRVKVRATPIVTSRFAAITLINGVLDETYEVREDKLTLIETEPPVDPKVTKVFGFDGF